jgi:hypothetical protein
MIFYHYLVVFHCSLEFTLLELKVEHAVVWIRFHVLNLVYYDDSFLLVMPTTIGLHIKVNNNTLKWSVADLPGCVEVDLTLKYCLKNLAQRLLI